MDRAALAPAPEGPQCRGVFARYREAAFRLKAVQGVKLQREVYELKSKSCPGCSKCGGIWDALMEFPDGIEFAPDVMNGDVVQLSVTVDSIDWESGHADDWHVIARKAV